MAAVDSALQTARIPALLMLLWATAIPVKDKLTAVRQLDTSLFWRPLVLASLVSVAFVVVMLVGRSRWHAWLLLLVEAGIAGTVAFVPPLYWLLWLGVSSSWSVAMTGGYAQPLGVAWLGVVGLRVVHQVQEARAAAASSGDDGGGGKPARKTPLDLVDG